MHTVASMQNHSVVYHVDALISGAIEKAASDIHLEPTAHHLRIRFRVDGLLYDQPPITSSIMQQVVSRLKVLAQMDIAEKRIPQDGKFTLSFEDKPVDFRVSTFPSLFGEKMVVRILDRAAHAMSLDQLGFAPAMLERINEISQKQSGFFLVTGPTGSGKTTTLYAILSALHAPEKNIITLENPVEYNLEGITQGHINTEAGFTFEKGIRALLRQDPDILMVGEIRDRETAGVAIEAALTGHLVLSTLHTNDAPSAVMRLMDMGIEPFLINASLSGVLAQRLVRKLCLECREPIERTELHEHLLKKLSIDEDIQLYAGRGCAWCDGLGYRGRIGIFELLVINQAFRALIVSHPDFDAIYEQVRRDGMHTLLQDGVLKLKEGVISLEELARVMI
ncbi:type II/IV secretion system protein [Candidatus Dependentiae bacterium]|nr:MAG: type II/IV secretion system protein [Candidatus Dependentiae bacterium]